MANSSNNRGRTFWDLIAEHPRMVFSVIITLMIVIVILALNKYSLKSPMLSLEPNKQQSTFTEISDSSKTRKANMLDTSALVQRRVIKNPMKNYPKEQLIIKDPKKDTVKTEIVNVTSNNQSGGITANQVNIGSVPRTLDINIQRQLLSFLNSKEESIVIDCIMGDSESFLYANQINDFLKSKGYNKVDGVNQSAFTKPVIGQFMDRDTSGVKILIGSNLKH